MSKYKAPWLYIKEQGMVYDNMGEIVCSTIPTGEQWEEDNAALIECAPDMRSMIEELSHHISSNSCEVELDSYRASLLRRTEKLLAKTRGKHE